MRKLTTLLAILLVIMSSTPVSCKRASQEGTRTSLNNSDFSSMLCDRSAIRLGSVCARSEKGLYFTEKMSENTVFSRMMYYDFESGTCGPLCGKAECTHDSEDCNAVFPWDIRAFAYYDGHLYYDLVNRSDKNPAPGRVICCCDETGENRRKIGTAAGGALQRSTGNAQGIFHLGKAIYSGTYEEIKNGVPHQGVTIASYDLKNAKDEIILYEQEFTAANVSGDIRMQAVLDKLYFMVISAEYKADGQRPDEYLLELYSLGIENGKTERLYSGTVDFYASEFWVIENGWLISSGADGRVYYFDQQNGSLNLWTDIGEYGPYSHAAFSEGIVFAFHPDDQNTSMCVLDFTSKMLLNDTHQREGYENLRQILCSDQDWLYVKYFRFDGLSKETVEAIDLHSGKRIVLWTDDVE